MNQPAEREPEVRYRIINGFRPVFTALAVGLAFYTGEYVLAGVSAFFTVMAIGWLIITGAFISPERQSGYLSLLPTFLDITLFTIYVYFTGSSLSSAILVYTYVVAVCSMNTRVPQGLVAVTYIVFIYSLLCASLWFGWLEPINLLGPARSASGPEMIQSLALVSLISLGVYFMVRGLVESLESNNEVLLEQSESLKEANRTLASQNRMIKDELVVARKIQETLIPSKMPEGKGFKIESRYIALHEVGGDYLDFFMKREGHQGILVADAAGHGVPAALVATMTKMAAEQSRSKMHHPRQFLTSLNNAILDRTNLHFVAAIYALYHARRRKLEYCVAGSPAPYLLRAGQPARQLEGQGSVLGVLPEPTLNQYKIHLEPGDRIVIFTDGINECRNKQGEELSLAQLESLLTGVARLDATENVADRIVEELQDFTSGRGFEDDVTLMVLSTD